jgi:small subunit ribosomal protein S21
MKKRKGFRKTKRPKDDTVGLSVKVYNDNVEEALRRFKRKVKDSNLLVELKNKQYYVKPSDLKREKKSKAMLREKYKILKDNE